MASESGVQKTAENQNALNFGDSQAAYNVLAPKYQQFVNNPQGFTPQQKSNMVTSTLQTNGGSTAGAVGQGGLFAARTNNAGGAAQAIDDAARLGNANQTNEALGIENQDDLLARQQQQQGLAGEQALYSGGNSAANDALGIASQNQIASANGARAWTKMGLQAVGAPVGG
jgi:hypothetical protein